jgi:hypothetical protein
LKRVASIVAVMLLTALVVCAQTPNGAYKGGSTGGVAGSPSGAYRAGPSTNGTITATYTVTDSTVVATWTSVGSSASNLSCGGKPAIDNGVAANSTSHQAIVTGLSPRTGCSCYVTSGSEFSNAQTVTTNSAQTRTLATNGSMTVPTFPFSGRNGDTMYSFVSRDNNTYVSMSDGYGIAASANAGANNQLDVYTNESALTGSTVNLMTNYGAFSTFSGTDGPGSTTMTNKQSGLFGMNGHLHLFVIRQQNSGLAWYGNIIRDNGDHGATWNNWLSPTTFNANGNFAGFGEGEYANSEWGWASPVRYAVDDGTLGYKTAGNQIDGANGFVYIHFFSNGYQEANDIYLMRIPRIQFDAQNASAFQFWAGPSSPAASDFVNDSNWSSSSSGMTSVFHSAQQYTWAPVVFIPILNSYVMFTEFLVTSTTPVSFPTQANSFYFLSAPTPAGPWTPVFMQGSRQNLYYGMNPFHRDATANMASNAISLRLLGSGAAAGFEQATSTFTLNTGGMAPLAFEEFGQATDESPLSDGGNWSAVSNAIFAGSMKVASQFALPNANSTNAISIWTGRTWPNDQYSEITVGPVDTTSSAWDSVRMNTAGTGYLLAIKGGTNGCSLFNEGSSAGQIGSSFTIAGLAEDDAIRLTVTGQSPVTLTVSRNGTVIQTFTDSTNVISSGSPGLGGNIPTAFGSIQFWSGGG